MGDLIDVCETGDLDEARRRLEAGADPNEVVGGWPVVCGALAAGQAEAARLVIEADGFDPNVAEPSGGTPLILTAQQDMPALARALLEANADPNAQMNTGATALFMAAQKGFTDVARALLEDGRTEVDKPGSGGATPLWNAADEGHLSVVNLLLKARRRTSSTRRSWRR
eukprot:COSAG04_NODE_3577_length_2697_cov_1.774057_1_plen_169_part_00